MSNIDQLIGKDNVNKIKSLFDKITPNHEFEFKFYGFNNKFLSTEKYVITDKYIKILGRNHPTTEEQTLDITYRKKNTNNNYRITIQGLKKINRYKKMFCGRPNHDIYNILAIMKDPSISLMNKIRKPENVIDINDLDIRVRLSEELPVSDEDLKKITSLTRHNTLEITFRLKQRISLYLYKKDDKYIRLDLTSVRTNERLINIENIITQYELEMEYGGEVDTKCLDIMFQESMKLLKMFNKTNYLISNTEANLVISEFTRILSIDANRLTSLSVAGRQAVSLEIQHVTELLPDRYAVTDKMDGERHMLIICNNKIYLLSMNLDVRFTGITIKDESYNGSILDGEYIYLTKVKRHVYMAFDCLFIGMTDIRSKSNFLERLAAADKIIENCCVIKDNTFYKIKSYEFKKEGFDIKDVMKFYGNGLKEYMENINKNLAITTNLPLIRRKYFLEVFGANSCEIFAYSALMYEKYTADKNIKCPYLLDGLVYHPLEQHYTTDKRENKFPEFKWKPPSQNSLDFYIEFEKDNKTGKRLKVYDNSVSKSMIGQSYYICRLYVGQRTKTSEIPTLFKEKEDRYYAYLFLDNGEVRDKDGNPIMDNTVVEFCYNDDISISERFRWIPIRTRFEKTDSVHRFKRKYGNSADVADKIWRSIVNPVLMSTIIELSHGGEIYERQMHELRSKISHELIISTTKEDKYYQVKNQLVSNMNVFHNWIKSNIIYTYCSAVYQDGKSQTVLDISCGRGGDILKFYYVKIAEYVGTDKDRETLLSAVNGAVSRYKQQKKSKPNFFKATFIHADSGVLFDYENQRVALDGMSMENKKNMDKYFNMQYDRINYQFAIHYIFKDELSWNNLKQNIKKLLKPGGYMMVTTFDAKKVMEYIGDNDAFTEYYTSTKGEKKVLFDVKKKYTEKSIDAVKLGAAIDIHASWMFREGQYQTEYLVNKDFFINDVDKDCNLEIVDTDLFGNQYFIHENYFRHFIQYEENPKTKKSLTNVSKYYEKSEINANCFKYSDMTRYYVFRKRNSSEELRKEQKGGNIKKILDSSNIEIKEPINDVNTYINSIHYILKKHELIPKSYSVAEFIDVYGMVDDDNYEKNIDEFNRGLVIEHEKKGKTSTVLNGIKSIVIEKDCTDNYVALEYPKHASRKCVLFLKDKGMFMPITRKEGSKYCSLFSYDDEWVREILNE